MQIYISMRTAAAILGISHTQLNKQLKRGTAHPDVIIETELGRATYGFDRARIEAQKMWRDSTAE